MTEQQAAESLNLDATAVVSIETNDFAALGAPVFVRGHLRRYATLLGLAEDEVLGAYDRSRQQADEPTLVPRARLEMLPVRNKPRWPWVLGGALAFLLAAAAVAWLSENGLPWTRASRPEVADAAVQDPSSTSVPDRPEAGAPTGTDATGTADAAAPGPATDGSQPFASQSSMPPPAGAATAGGTVTGTDAPATPAAAPLPGQVVLQLRFSADSWVEVFDGSGRAVVFELGKAGSERNLTATAPLSVTLGNGPGVAVTVNGRPQTPPGPGGQALVRFSVAPDGTLR